MKNNKLTTFLCFNILFITVFFVNCTKNDINYIAKFDSNNNSSFIKLIHISPNLTTLNILDSINIKVDDKLIFANFITYGGLFPSLVNNYFIITSGSHKITILSKTKQKIDTILKNINYDFEANSYYSLIINDGILNSNQAQIIKDINIEPSTNLNVFKIRFLHLVLNDTVGKNIDIYSIKLKLNIFQNISSNTITDFKELPFIKSTLTPYNEIDTFIVRRTGIGYELARLITNSNPAPLQSFKTYSLIYRGNAVGTVKAKGLFLYSNK